MDSVSFLDSNEREKVLRLTQLHSSALYFFLGSSKELSTGPTSILGLLTAEVVHDLSKEGYAPEKIASAIAFMAGTYALAVGLLKLGFLVSDTMSGGSA
jgi:MFS superfamily sulfate permease-like transporter